MPQQTLADGGLFFGVLLAVAQLARRLEKHGLHFMTGYCSLIAAQQTDFVENADLDVFLIGPVLADRFLESGVIVKEFDHIE